MGKEKIMKPKLNKSALIVFTGVYALLVFFLSFSDTAYADFAKRKKITIQASQVNGASAHTNFPVMIELTGSHFQEIENDVDADGYDLVFKTAGGALLAHEIEVYNESTNQLVAWVKIPSLSATANTDIYVHYGDPSISSPTETPTAVWDSNYRAVWHLKENPAGASPQIKDSTVYSNDGSSVGSMTSGDLVSGKIAGALDFDGSNDYIDVGNDSSLDVTTGITLEAWLECDAIEAADRFPLFKWNAYFLDGMRSWDTSPHFYMNVAGVGWKVAFPSGDLTTSWSQVVATYDSTEKIERLYVNGVEIASLDLSALSSHLIATSSNIFQIGRTFDGIIDEARLSDKARSGDWIKTQYNNQNSPSLFYVIGSEQDMDSIPPTVTITSPTSDPTYSTDAESIALAGTAGDNLGIVEVTWSNNRGGSGVCSGTTSWSADITLYPGDNVITVWAEDTAGNTTADVLTVDYTPGSPDPESEPEYGQCATGVFVDYSAGFNAADLDLVSIATVGGRLVLQTGSQAIDHENIIIPFEQDVCVTFLYSKTAHENDFGWFLRDDAVDGSGNFIGYTNIPDVKKYAIFRNVHDGNVFIPVDGDGILDIFQDQPTQTTTMSESAVAAYDDVCSS
jgi:hypothetical protein